MIITDVKIQVPDRMVSYVIASDDKADRKGLEVLYQSCTSLHICTK